MIPIPPAPSPVGDAKVHDSVLSGSTSRAVRDNVSTYLRNVTETLVNDVLDSLTCPLDGEWIIAHRRAPALSERVVPVDQQLQM
jgi:hypothetical protein